MNKFILTALSVAVRRLVGGLRPPESFFNDSLTSQLRLLIATSGKLVRYSGVPL